MIARMVLSVSALVWAASFSAQAHAPGQGGHDHAEQHSFAAGEPGDPRKPSRIVQISMRETDDGRMLFTPGDVSVRAGEQVKFVLRNIGKVEHEFLLDSIEGNAAHKVAMAANPKMEHQEQNGVELESGKVGELIWRFTKPGSFEFACLIPGHYEAGMKGTVVVK